MQAHKSRKVKAFTGVNLFFCFVSRSSVNFFIDSCDTVCSLLNSTVWGMIWPFESFSSPISFGRFMTDLYCRFWIWIDRGHSLISVPHYSPVEEKNFLESYFFKIPRLPSHSQMDEQLPRAFKQSFNQFHGTAADQFWRWCRDIADVNLFHLNHQRRALIGEPEVFNLSRCLARLCTFRISTSLDFHLYFPTFLISTF